MWEHALGIKLCQCLPVGLCHLPLCLSHITYISVRVVVHSLALARIDILPEDGPTVNETCWRFYEIVAF